MPAVSSLTLEEKIGQMLVVGFPGGAEGLSALREIVSATAAGNVILFARNAGAPDELRKTTDAVRSIISERRGLPPLVAVDQEGGVVARVRDGVTSLPGAMAQAAAVGSGAYGVADIRELARIAGTELLALGMDWDLAPVADVNVNPLNPVIGVRSYGQDPASVAELATAFAAGLADAGVLATAKHFPGHGDTTVDSHLDLPLVPHSAERLEAVELIPFRALVRSLVPVIMTAHVRFPAYESEPIPATLSRKVITGLLRGALGFRGIIATDCMEMKAIAGRFPDAAVMAVEAGCDMITVSQSAEAQLAAFRSILAAVASGRIAESRIDESVARILAAKASVGDPPEWAGARADLRSPRSLALAEGIMEAALSLLREGAGLPPAPGSLYVDTRPEGLSAAENPHPRAGSGVVAGVASGAAAPGTVAASLAHLSGLEVVSLGPDPGEGERAAVLARAAEILARPATRGGRGLPGIIMGAHNAPKYPGQLALAAALSKACAAAGRPFALCCMRGPYDTAAIERAAGVPLPALCAFEYTPLSAAKIAKYLTGGIRAAGRCPVEPYATPDGYFSKEVI
ncbi:MAG: beta-N-acetylhexosaminidase [Spirochaetaceae bacterium]|nr:beta-N-acetylhexosaminidase [Spirochaetaceae bacterium]